MVRGGAHGAVALQAEVVYGLTELARDEVRTARLVANPGCYPTSAQLPLAPLLENGLIETDDIIIDAKSGVSGAGREAKQGSLFAEGRRGRARLRRRRPPPRARDRAGIVRGGRRARTRQLHAPSHADEPRHSGNDLRAQSRGAPTPLRDALARRYADEPFVRVLPAGAAPATRHVRGLQPLPHRGSSDDRIEGRAILISAIDNLVKGASGQAIQNMNLMHALPETTGLEQAPLFP